MKKSNSNKHTKNSFFKRWFGFFVILLEFVIDLVRTFVIRYLAFFRRKPFTAVFVPLGAIFLALVVGSATAYVIFDYTQNDPSFCTQCHTLMHESYDTWKASVHHDVNCHSCHHFTVQDATRLLGDVLREGWIPSEIPERPHGIVIVKWKLCADCHWYENEEYPTAQKIASSKFHASHFFMGETECIQCHSYELHNFVLDEESCLRCHQNKEDKIHRDAAEEVTCCMYCHTESTSSLEPERRKCLFCHGTDESIREELSHSETLDIRHFPPSPESIQNALKIETPEDAPMQQLACQDCHKAHKDEDDAMRKYESCLQCHPRIEKMGQHPRHVMFAQEGRCAQCHQPHSWSIDEEWAQTECAKCHQYQAPYTFNLPEKL